MQKPEVGQSSAILKMGNGAEVPVQGTVVLPVVLGQTQFTETFLVAPIEEEGVIGIPFMHKAGFQLDLRHMLLKNNEGFIACYDKNATPSVLQSDSG